MQIPGAKCSICAQRIIIAPDGTWCDRCKSLFHTTCVNDHHAVCPTCNAEYVPPDESALLDAQGRSALPHRCQRPSRLGPTIEIIAGGAFLVSPVVLLLVGMGLSLTGTSSTGLIGVLPFMIIFMILGVVLVVDGERNFR